jgi:predicted SnoaL-like aldol condensation-catalyzing enzyme
MTTSVEMKPTHKDAALAFLRLTIAGHVSEAFGTYVALSFRHHNPMFRGDAESLRAAMEANVAKNPDMIIEVKHALEDGDLVAVHSRVRLAAGEPGVAVVHIFRFEGDAIAEMWDVGQPAPEGSPNEMF